MFDISFSELTVASAVALLVLGPKEFSKAVKFLRRSIASIKNWWQKTHDDVNDKDEGIVKYIMDLEGNMRATYDLSEIMPDIKNASDDKKAKKKEITNRKKTSKET